MVHDFCYYRVRQKYNLTLGCHTYLVSYNVSCCHEQKYTKCTDSGPSKYKCYFYSGVESVLLNADSVLNRLAMCVAPQLSYQNSNLFNIVKSILS